MSIPEWADRYRKLAKEAGSTSGAWSTATVEIARGPMLAATEPGVHIITVMSCTQLLKTALVENVFGYYAHLDPCPMLLLQPKQDAAEQFSKERITPLIRATPALRDLIGTTKTRSADETLLFKTFPGGFLALAGAGSPDNLARRPIRILLCDEVDKYPVTREGDPIMLAEERTATFGANWLSIRACSPTVEDESRIAASYEESDQRRASLACPHCGHRQFPDFFRHVNWSKENGEHKPGTARIYCEACGTGWTEGQRLKALATARWHQTRPFTCCGLRQAPLEEYARAWADETIADPAGEVWDWCAGERFAVYRARCRKCRAHAVPNEHAGFQASKLFSPWPKDKPADIARKWLAARGDSDREQTWWNTQQGLPHRVNSGKKLGAETLLARGEVWDAEVPDGVAVITAGGDFQGDRAEFEFVGWGRNEESWSLAHEVIEGDPETPEFWTRVDQLLRRVWRRADGRGIATMAACLDSGHHTQHVYEFARQRLGRRIWAIKGESARMGQRSPVWPVKRPSSRNKAAFRPVIIGTNAAKDVIHARLQVEQAGPGYMHFPADRDLGWFQQLVSERQAVKRLAGRTYRIWELPGGRANEALDCRVYAYAALCGLLHFGLKLNRAADAAARPPRPDRAMPGEIPAPAGAAARSAAPAQQPAAGPQQAARRPDGPSIKVAEEKSRYRFKGRMAGA